MRKLWLRSLALSLGLVVTSVRGQEGVWRSSPASPAGQASPPVAALAKPIAIATSRPVESAPTAPAASLGRPLVIASTPSRDEGVQPASFTPARDPMAPVARGRAPDVVVPRPMPNGPAVDVPSMPTPGYSMWRRADEVVASTVSRNPGEASPTAAPPIPLPGSGTLVAPTPVPTSPPVVSPPPVFGGASNAPINAGPYPPVTMGGPPMYGKAGPPMTYPPASCVPPTCAAPAVGMAPCGPWGAQDCCDGPRCVLVLEQLYWWMTGDNTPALVNAAPPGTPLNTTAFTNVLSGDNAFAGQAFNGGRIRGLYWFTPNRCWGIDGSAFFLAEQQDNFFAQSDGVSQQQLGRPFINLTPGTNVGAPLAEIVSGANEFGRLVGSVQVQHRTSLWGFDANLRRNLWCGDILNLDMFFGYRQLGLQDDLTITERLVVTQNFQPAVNPNAPGTTFGIQDKFSTSNRFYGGQVGLDTEWRMGKYTIGARGSVALGCTQQTIDISGFTARTVPGGATTTEGGGLLALGGTNIGRYTRQMFGVVPEAGLTLGCDVCDWFRMTCGYNFMYWNNVARAGEQIDNGVNLTYAPATGVSGLGTQVGTRRPAFQGNTQDLFIHGLTFGFEFRY